MNNFEKSVQNKEPLLPMSQLYMYMQRCWEAGIEMRNICVYFFGIVVEQSKNCLYISGLGYYLGDPENNINVKVVLDRNKRHVRKTNCECDSRLDVCVHVLAFMFEVRFLKLREGYSKIIDDDDMLVPETVDDELLQRLTEYEEHRDKQSLLASAMIVCDGQNCPHVTGGACVLNPVMPSAYMEQIRKPAVPTYIDCQLFGLGPSPVEVLTPAWQELAMQKDSTPEELCEKLFESVANMRYEAEQRSAVVLKEHSIFTGDLPHDDEMNAELPSLNGAGPLDETTPLANPFDADSTGGHNDDTSIYGFPELSDALYSPVLLTSPDSDPETLAVPPANSSGMNLVDEDMVAMFREAIRSTDGQLDEQMEVSQDEEPTPSVRSFLFNEHMPEANAKEHL